MRWHGRRSVIGALVALALVATAVPVGAAIDPGSYTLKQRDFLIGGDDPGLGGGSVGCGQGMRVVTGGAYWHLEGGGPYPGLNVYLSSSSPTKDGKRWFAAGINWGDTDAYLTVYAYCLPASVIGPYTVRTVESTVTADVGRDRRCPTGTRVVTGGAYWHQPGAGPDPAVEGYLRSSAPDGDARGWYVAAYNDQAELRLTTVALCVPTGSIGRYTVRTRDVPIVDGDAVTEDRTCGPGKRAVGGGAFWHQPGEGRDPTLKAYLRGSFPTEAGRRWFAVGQNLADLDLSLRIVVLCLPT